MHTYFPDFIVRDKIYEIKGYVKEVDKIKFSSVPGLVVITGDRMNRYLDYVIQKYGDNFIYLYDKSYNRLSKKNINIKKPKEVVKDHRWSDYEKIRVY